MSGTNTTNGERAGEPRDSTDPAEETAKTIAVEPDCAHCDPEDDTLNRIRARVLQSIATPARMPPDQVIRHYRRLAYLGTASLLFPSTLPPECTPLPPDHRDGEGRLMADTLALALNTEELEAMRLALVRQQAIWADGRSTCIAARCAQVVGYIEQYQARMPTPAPLGFDGRWVRIVTLTRYDWWLVRNQLKDYRGVLGGGVAWTVPKVIGLIDDLLGGPSPWAGVDAECTTHRAEPTPAPAEQYDAGPYWSATNGGASLGVAGALVLVVVILVGLLIARFT